MLTNDSYKNSIFYIFYILSEALTGLLKDCSSMRHGSKQITTAPQT